VGQDCSHSPRYVFILTPSAARTVECCDTLSHHLQIVDIAIWMLFSKAHASNGRVHHLICQGFRKDLSSRSVHRGENVTSAIQGVISTYPNSHVTSLKAWPWPEILALLGKEGERVMIDLILDCGIFLRLGSGHGNYHQLSGQPTTHSVPLL
jgi:telomerase reverse transcriptase